LLPHLCSLLHEGRVRWHLPVFPADAPLPSSFLDTIGMSSANGRRNYLASRPNHSAYPRRIQSIKSSNQNLSVYHQSTPSMDWSVQLAVGYKERKYFKCSSSEFRLVLLIGLRAVAVAWEMARFTS
jgi:hypothetical protein